MGRLVWDQVGERRYETGVDRGVLYLPDGDGVPWNGLTSIEQDTSDETTTAYYYDGVKYLDTKYPGDYSGSLKAVTYPDEFLQFDGLMAADNGMLLDNQPSNGRFGLCYRTLIGNDTEGVEYGYKIHVVYNLMASPDNRAYNTLTDQNNVEEFSWKISATPERVPGFRPTAHIVLDTRRMNSYLIKDLENLLYGTDDDTHPIGNEIFDGGTPSEPSPYIFDGGTPYDVTGPVSSSNQDVDGGTPFSTTESSGLDSVDGGSPESGGTDYLDGGTPFSAGSDFLDGGTSESSDTSNQGDPDPGPKNTPTAKLPPLADLFDMITKWSLIDVVDNGDGTWTAKGPADFIKFLDPTTFDIIGADASYLDEYTYTIRTTHGF